MKLRNKGGAQAETDQILKRANSHIHVTVAS